MAVSRGGVRFLFEAGPEHADKKRWVAAWKRHTPQLVPVLRRGRPLWEFELPLAELAPFPKLVVSGGHSAGFDAICDDLAERIGASRMVVEGAGHEIQFTGRPLNEALRALWGTASSGSASLSS